MFAWRRLGALAVVVALALAAAGTARAGSFSLISADVGIDVRSNGSLGVSERIEVAFDGAFHYGYRDIPLREGESLENVTVAEGGRAYSRGSRTDLSRGPVSRSSCSRCSWIM